MPRYEIPVWKMCEKALEELGDSEKLVSLKAIVNKVHELWPRVLRGLSENLLPTSFFFCLHLL